LAIIDDLVAASHLYTGTAGNSLLIKSWARTNGSMIREVVAGRPAIRHARRCQFENKGGFVQIAIDLMSDESQRR
jgi:hypothetical protein